jgi:hypothetical protein
MQPCKELLHDFNFFSLFDFVYAIDVKNKSYFSISDGLLVVNAIFLAWDDVRSKSKPMLGSKTFAQNIGDG